MMQGKLLDIAQEMQEATNKIKFLNNYIKEALEDAEYTGITTATLEHLGQKCYQIDVLLTRFEAIGGYEREAK